MSSELLDNPSWHALTGPLARFAEGTGQARRFRPDVSIFAAIADDTPASWADLGALYGSGHEVLLIRNGSFNPPARWTIVGGGTGFQMVLQGDLVDPRGAAAVPLVRELTDHDVPAMVELIQLTEPGPFRERTIELGGYVGIEEDGRLLAMAGQRNALPGYIEISAVCTHPVARRRGYAAAVTAAVARNILAAGSTPILHVAESNVGAKRVYEQLGFVTRTTLAFTALRTP